MRRTRRDTEQRSSARECVRVLIADDDEHIRRSLMSQLHDAGYDSVAVGDGVAALETLRTQSFDIALVDLEMPRKDGFQLLADIREAGLEIVPVVLAGTGNTPRVAKAMKLGAFDFLEKPCNPDLLDSAIRRAIDYRQATRHATHMQRIAEQWEDAFDTAPDRLIVTDVAGCIMRCNRAAANHTGVEPEALVGRDCHNALCGDAHTPDQCPLAPFQDEGPHKAAELWGGWYEVSTRPLRDRQGSTWGRMTVARDVTEQHKTRMTLIENEARLSTVLNTILTGVVIIDEETHTILDANPQAIELLRAPKEEIVGKVCHEFICPTKAGECPVTDLSHTLQKTERILLTSDGERVPVLKTVMRAWIGGRRCLVDSFLDISEFRKAQSALRDNEEKLRAITGVALDAILMMTPEGRISFYNRAAEEMFGWSAEEALGGDLHALLAPKQYHGAFMDGMGPFRLSGQGPAIGKRLELKASRKDGSEFPIEIALSSVRINGEWHAVGTIRDITVRKRNEDALRLSEERFRALFNSSRDAIMTVEPPSWRFTSGNPACLRMFGVKTEQAFTSLGPWEVSPDQQPDGRTSAEKAREMIETAMHEGSHFFEWRHKRMTGEEFPATVLLTRVEIGEHPFLQATVRDITTRKSLEEQLRASEEKFRQIVDNVGVGVSLVSPELRIVELNRRMREWFPEVRPEEHPLCHQAFNDPPAKSPCSYCPTVRTLLDGQVHEAMTATPQKQGTRNYRIVSSPIHDHQGHVTAAIELVEDITERLRMERESSQAQKLEAVGRLAAGIAHEINTPTQYVGDNIEFLQIAFGSLSELAKILDGLLKTRGPLPGERIAEARTLVEDMNLDYLLEQIPRAIDQSIEGVGRISSIVQAMKEFSHPGSTEKTYVDLNQCIRSTVTVSRNEWKYVSDLELDLADDPPQICCLAGEMNQVFLNMIVNASHAISDVVGSDGAGGKGKITIRTHQEGSWYVITIEDSGSGIPEDIRERIFDPFFTTKGVGRGTGQGLAIARNVVVDKHGGTITVDSEVGKGTTFRIKLPISGEDQGISHDFESGK